MLARFSAPAYQTACADFTRSRRDFGSDFDRCCFALLPKRQRQCGRREVALAAVRLQGPIRSPPSKILDISQATRSRWPLHERTSLQHLDAREESGRRASRKSRCPWCSTAWRFKIRLTTPRASLRALELPSFQERVSGRDSLQSLPDAGRMSSEVGHGMQGQTWGNVGRRSPEVGPESVQVSAVRPMFDGTRPNSGRNQPNPAEFGPTSAEV